MCELLVEAAEVDDADTELVEVDSNVVVVDLLRVVSEELDGLEPFEWVDITSIGKFVGIIGCTQSTSLSVMVVTTGLSDPDTCSVTVAIEVLLDVSSKVGSVRVGNVVANTVGSVVVVRSVKMTVEAWLFDDLDEVICLDEVVVLDEVICLDEVVGPDEVVCLDDDTCLEDIVGLEEVVGLTDFDDLDEVVCLASDEVCFSWSVVLEDWIFTDLVEAVVDHASGSSSSSSSEAGSLL